MKNLFFILVMLGLMYPMFAGAESGLYTNEDVNLNLNLSDFGLDGERHPVSNLFVNVPEDRPRTDRVAFRDDEPVRVPITETWFAGGYIFLKYEGACFTPNYWAGGFEAPQAGCLDTYAVKIPDFYWARWIEKVSFRQSYLDRIEANQEDFEIQSFSSFLTYLDGIDRPKVIDANSNGICVVGYYTDDAKIADIKERYRYSQVEKGQLRYWCSIMYPKLDVPLFYFSKLTDWDRRDGLRFDHLINDEETLEETSLFYDIFPALDPEKTGARGQR